jgi:hypothetical protein
MVSTYADRGLFRLQGKVFFTSDITNISKTLSTFSKCNTGPLYIETFLGDKLSFILKAGNPKLLKKLISYQKLHHHAVVNSSTRISIAAKAMYKKCFKTMSDDAYALSLSEYYLKDIIKNKRKITELLSELEKQYPHELLGQSSTPELWIKK